MSKSKTKRKYKTDASFGVIPMRLHDGRREFLLIRHLAGHWAFPKGHADQGETLSETAAREFTEETGLKLEKLHHEHRFVEHYEYERPGRKPVRKTVTYFLGDVAAGEVVMQADEVSAFHWGDADATRELITFDASRRLFEQVLKYLGR